MPRLPQVSGNHLVAVLERIGYIAVRQRGSHVRLKKNTATGEHAITVPLHNPIAKGTLNDIIGRVSLWNSIPRDELIREIRRR